MTEAIYTSAGNDSGFTVIPNPGQAVAKIADRTTGMQYDTTTGRYTGTKTAGLYQNGEQISFTITAANTGDCDLIAPVITEDLSEYKDYISNVTLSVKKGDKVKTAKGNEVVITDITKTDHSYQITVDKLAAQDKLEITMTGEVTNVTQRLENLKNTASIKSSFVWDSDGGNNVFTCSAPDTIVGNVNHSKDSDQFHLSGLGSITIKKTSDKGVLEGVTYKLVGDDGTVYEKTTDKDGALTFFELPSQSYTLTEVRTVNGYQLLADNISVTLPLKLSADEVTEKRVDTSKGYYSEANKCWYFYDLTYEIKDDAILELPKAGLPLNMEIMMGILAAAAVFAGVMVLTKQKNK